MSNETTRHYADTIGASRISISDCHKTIIPILNAGHTPCLHGEAGIGKTEVAEQISSAMGIGKEHFLPVIVSQEVCSDFMIPFRGADGNYFEIMLSEKFKPIFQAGEEGKPSMVFFDEITRYQDAETASFIFSIISDRRIGNKRLPENCYIMAACNPDNGSYQVNDILNDPAWRRRLGHIEVYHDVSGWLKWAKSEEVHEWVIDYVSSNIDMLLDEKARAAGKIYATPASWAKVSKFLKHNNNMLSVAAISTYIGYDLSSDFVVYTEDSEFKLSPATVISDWPTTLEVLTRIGKAKRGDLVTRLVTSVVLYTYSNKPDTVEAAKNICKFWAHISAESKVKLATELFNRKEEGDSYFALLMSEITSHSLWRNKILPEVKHCMS
jgi:hypothetical protein